MKLSEEEGSSLAGAGSACRLADVIVFLDEITGKTGRFMINTVNVYLNTAHIIRWLVLVRWHHVRRR